MSNTKTKAQREFEILKKTNNGAIILEFEKEILDLVDAFGNSGQSGGSAPFYAKAISQAVEKLCMHETISPITGDESEWGTLVDMVQNNRNSAIFKDDKGSFYLYAIIWKGEDEWDTFAGWVEGISSTQYIKEFPFYPKRFYINVYRELYNKEKHGDDIDVVGCGNGDYVYFIKDKTQLDEVFEYYKKPTI